MLLESGGEGAQGAGGIVAGQRHPLGGTSGRAERPQVAERLRPLQRLEAVGPPGDRQLGRGVRDELQEPAGPVRWSRGPEGDVADEALVTGNASIHLSLRCGVALADVVGEDVARWREAAVRLRRALDHEPRRFADKARFSMDWYYPVLGGALPRDVALARLDARWDDFVVPGFGARCVDDSPWVTGGETCELVLALDAVGRSEDARRILGEIQVLRRDDATYWTGYVYPDETYWPVEQTTWTAGTVLLAVDALTRTTPASGLFRGEGLPRLADDEERP